MWVCIKQHRNHTLSFWRFWLVADLSSNHTHCWKTKTTVIRVKQTIWLKSNSNKQNLDWNDVISLDNVLKSTKNNKRKEKQNLNGSDLISYQNLLQYLESTGGWRCPKWEGMKYSNLHWPSCCGLLLDQRQMNSLQLIRRHLHYSSSLGCGGYCRQPGMNLNQIQLHTKIHKTQEKKIFTHSLSSVILEDWMARG